MGSGPPETQARPCVDPLETLRLCVAHGLPAAVRIGNGHQPPELTAGVISLACQHRVQGLLWAAIVDGVVVGDPATVDYAQAVHLDALRTCLLSEETAALALSALSHAGVKTRVLKGIAISHLDHDDPAERVFADADLLIRRDDYSAALTALTSAGFRRSKPPIRNGWEQRFAKAVVLYAPSGGELDLHLTITGGYFGELIDHDRLWSATGEPFDLAGVTAFGLDLEGRLLQACCHVILGGQSGLRARRDVVQLALISNADWRAVVARATRDGVEHVVAAAVRTAWIDLGLNPDHELARWANGLAHDPVQHDAIAGYTDDPGNGWAAEGRGTLAALGTADRLRFLAGLAFPSRASRRYRGRTWRQHLGSGLRALGRR